MDFVRFLAAARGADEESLFSRRRKTFVRRAKGGGRRCGGQLRKRSGASGSVPAPAGGCNVSGGPSGKLVHMVGAGSKVRGQPAGRIDVEDGGAERGCDGRGKRRGEIVCVHNGKRRGLDREADRCVSGKDGRRLEAVWV